MTTTMVRKVTCDGFHGRSTIEIDESRIVNEWVDEYTQVDAAWLSAKEMQANAPCGIRGCCCGDGYEILDTRGHDEFGDSLVMLFDD